MGQLQLKMHPIKTTLALCNNKHWTYKADEHKKSTNKTAHRTEDVNPASHTPRNPKQSKFSVQEDGDTDREQRSIHGNQASMMFQGYSASDQFRLGTKKWSYFSPTTRETHRLLLLKTNCVIIS